MDPLSLLSAGIGGISAIANMGQQQQANNINWRAVLDSEANTRKQEELQTAPRGDALGNKLVYVPGQGWSYQLTPQSKSELSADQKERLASLTQDAPRNRAAAVRMDDRSKVAADDFEQEYNKYKYRPQDTEANYIANARTQLMNSRKEGLDSAANLLAQQLLRTGSSSNVGAVYKKAGDEFANSLADVNTKADQLGRQNYHQETQANDQPKLDWLSTLKGIADKTTTSPVQGSSINSDLTGRADTALQQLSGVLQQGNASTQAALARVGASTANTQFDPSSILSGLKGAQDAQTEQDKLRQQLYMFQMKQFPSKPGAQTGLW